MLQCYFLSLVLISYDSFQELVYHKETDGVSTELILEIHQVQNGYLLTSHENDISIKTNYDHNWQFISQEHSRRINQLSYDAESGVFTTNSKTHQLRQAPFISTPAFVHVIGKLVSSSIPTRDIVLWSSDGSSHFPFRLKSAGLVQLEQNGEHLKCHQVTMSMRGMNWLFWPNEYQYWFDRQTGLLVRYEGRNSDKQKETLILKSDKKM